MALMGRERKGGLLVQTLREMRWLRTPQQALDIEQSGKAYLDGFLQLNIMSMRTR